MSGEPKDGELGGKKPTSLLATLPEAGGGHGVFWVCLGLLVILLSQLAWVRLSNFGGYDEWLLLSLTSRGIIDSPYSNRPLNFLWALPATWLVPYRFSGFYLLHAIYLWFGGICTFFVCHRLLPNATFLAFLTGVFSVAWMPSDLMRLSAVQGTYYSGCTFGMLLAVLLYTESWLRRSSILLAMASVSAYVAVRSYEVAFPVLLFVPLVVLTREVASSRKRWPWLLAWVFGLSVALTQALWPMMFPTGEPTYQNSVFGGLNTDPVLVFTRLVRQYGFHLVPLFQSRWTELLTPAVAASILAFMGTLFLAARRFATGMHVPQRRGILVGLMAIGLTLSGLGYFALVVGGADLSATRMQFFATPGIALFLASSFCLAATSTPKAFQVPVAALLASWVVAVGSGRTIGMQRAWDTFDYEPRQRLLLSQLVALAPDFRPGTLVLLIDEAKVWPATFGFRHAVEYLYPDRATGYVWDALDLLYPTTLNPDGVKTVPWASIQIPWGARPTTHGYADVVVFRLDVFGGLTRLDQWPADLPALPKETNYLPRARLTQLSRDLPERAVLR